MIEMSQFILNSVVSSDPVINATDEAQPELLLNTDEQQIDDSVLLDPGAFVLLMAQMLSTGTISPDKSEQSELIPDDQTESAVDGESKNQPGIVATDEINKEILTSAQPDLNLEKNIAMTWINSGTYTPPQAQIAVSSTDNELRAATDFETLLTKESVIPDVLIKAMSYFKGDKENNFVAPPADTDIDIENTNVAKQTTIKENPLNQLTELMEQVAPGAVLKAPVTMTVLNPAHYDNETKQNTEKPLIETPLTSSGQVAPTAQQIQQNTVSVPVTKTLNIPLDINNPQWADKFSDHIVWLGQQSVKSALIRIHPEDLGPIDISVKVLKDSATVSINSHSSHVCNIVDQSIPRLRELMAEQGLNLADVHISSDSNSQSSSQNNSNGEQNVVHAAEDEVLITPLQKKPIKGLIDFFA